MSSKNFKKIKIIFYFANSLICGTIVMYFIMSGMIVLKKIITLLIIFTFVFSMPVFAKKSKDFLSVVDNADVLSEETERYIYTQNKLLSEKTGARIIFYTAEDTGELNVSEYASKLFDELGVSKIGRSNSVFVFMCTGDRDYSLIVSNGISASLTNSYAQKCLVEYMEPDFDKGDYDKASVRCFNAFGNWYSDTYSIDMEFTEDLSEYKSIIKTEKQQRKIRTAFKVIFWIVLVVSVLYALIRYRREKRMKKLREKRQERRKRYMQIK